MLAPFGNGPLPNDRRIVLAAAEETPRSLGRAPARFRDDREVVRRALKVSRGALRFASKRLRNDRAILLEAATRESSREICIGDLDSDLLYASDRLRDDPKLVLAEVDQSPLGFPRFTGP